MRVADQRVTDAADSVNRSVPRSRVLKRSALVFVWFVCGKGILLGGHGGARICCCLARHSSRPPLPPSAPSRPSFLTGSWARKVRCLPVPSLAVHTCTRTAQEMMDANRRRPKLWSSTRRPLRLRCRIRSGTGSLLLGSSCSVTFAC